MHCDLLAYTGDLNMPIAQTNRSAASLNQALNLPFWETSDATPIEVPVMSIPNDCTVRATVLVLARADTGTSRSWLLVRTGKNVGEVLSLVGSPPSVVSEADPGALSWSVQLSATGADVYVTLTGAVATHIVWAVVTDYLLVSTAV
jgi:hypothetical protein